MNKGFVLFKKHFEHYQKLFGLTGYKVYFTYEPLDTGYASITVNQNQMVATARLASNLSSEDNLLRSVEQSAKHEAIHLLLFRLEHRACARYVMSEEIDEAIEELVFKLEDLIK